MSVYSVNVSLISPNLIKHAQLKADIINECGQTHVNCRFICLSINISWKVDESSWENTLAAMTKKKKPTKIAFMNLCKPDKCRLYRGHAIFCVLRLSSGEKKIKAFLANMVCVYQQFNAAFVFLSQLYTMLSWNRVEEKCFSCVISSILNYTKYPLGTKSARASHAAIRPPPALPLTAIFILSSIHQLVSFL